MHNVRHKDLNGFFGSGTGLDSTGFHLIAAESEVFTNLSRAFIRSVLENHQDSTKYLIHVLAFDSWTSNLSKLYEPNTIIMYDYFHRGFESLESFYEEFTQNHDPKLKNIVLFDKLNILNCYCSHLFPNLKLFYKTLRKHTYRLFGLINSSFSSSKELSEAYGNADLIALMLNKRTDMSSYICYLMKNRHDTKPSLNEVSFNIVDGVIQQIEKDVSNPMLTVKNDDSLAALTTFRLTLNETERESRSKLHLPYFDAQRKDTSETETAIDADDDDSDEIDDEEDEEV